MAIDKKLIHFKNWNTFISSTGVNGNYTTPSSGTEDAGNAVYGQIKGSSIVFIKDVGKIWTHGKVYDCNNTLPDLSDYITNEELSEAINPISTQLASLTTDNVAEGNNKYFTNARALSALTGQTSALTASRVLVSNTSGKIAASSITSTELGYLSGVTSGVQTQLNAKASASSVSSLSTEVANKADKSDLEDLATKDELTSGLSGKQATLISGTNIKTIEGTSLLGSGDIQITASQVGAYTTGQVDDKFTSVNTEISGIKSNKADKSTTLAGYGITDGVNAKTETGSGNVITSTSISGHTITFTKGITAATKTELDNLTTTVSNLTTTNVSEGTNKYFTDARARSAITGGASTIAGDNLTASRALISSSSGKVAVSAVTSTELGYLDGVTSNIQTQLNDKASKSIETTVSDLSGKVTTNTNNITAVGNRVSTLEEYFATSEDTDDIINKWVDVVEFLDGMAEGNTDGEKLDAILAAKANQSALDQTNSNLATIDAKFANYKPIQTAVSSPTAADTTSTTFIDTVSQNANGVITATKKTLPSASTSAKGIVQLTNSTSSTSTTTAATPSSVKSAYDLANGANTTASTVSGYFESGKAKSAKVADSATTATTATNLASAPSLAAGTTSTNAITVTAGGKTSSEFTVPYATKAGSANSASTATSATTADTANKTAKTLTLKVGSGSTEGTNKYTFNGSADKTLDIKAGNNISLSTASGSVTINATDIPQFYYIEGTGTTDSTAKTSTWTGSHSLITAYTPGLTVAYKVGIAGQTSTTLNINNLGAVTVVKNATTAISTTYPVNSVVLLTYTLDGTTAYWKVSDQNSTYSNASLGNGYATCSTAAATVAKTASLSSYALATGGMVSVRFTNGITVANPTLNVNSKGAKAIYYKGAALTDTTLIGAGDIVTFVYSTYYYITSILKADQTLTLTGDVTASASVDPNKETISIATTLANSGVTAGSYGPSANAAPVHGGTFSVPYVTVDAKGRLTSASTKTITMPSDRLFVTLVPSGTAIPANADLNTVDYLKVGRYYCSANTTVATLKNSPLSTAFMMEVYSPLAVTVDNETTGTWVYRLRKMTHYNTGVVYTQYCYVGGTAGAANWVYGDWAIAPQSLITLAESGNGSTVSKGSATKPIYIDANGRMNACTYSLGASVPSDAKFTDTTYSAGTGLTLSGTTFSANGSAIINSLGEGTSPSQRNDYIVTQYAGGGTSNTSYYRRKLSNVFAALNASDITTALGYTPSQQKSVTLWGQSFDGTANVSGAMTGVTDITMSGSVKMGSGSASISYDSTEKCIKFVF